MANPSPQTPSAAKPTQKLPPGRLARHQAPAPDEVRAIAEEAYVYLYPLITMDLTRRQMIGGDPKTQPMAGPANQFVHIRSFPTADMRVVVRPNFDTLYSSAWLDLTGGPVVVSTRNTGGRYFLLPMLDMWTDVFASPGKRTSGTGAASFAITPRGWSGTLPEGVSRIEAPTPHVWIIGRTQTNGPADFDAVHKIQDGYTITPLAEAGHEPPAPTERADPGLDSKTPPLEVVNGMRALDFFKYGAELMRLNPPHATDWSMLARMHRIGFEPGRGFDPAGVDIAALRSGAAAGLRLMQDKAPTIARMVNGWQMNTDTVGVYGDYYLKRAIFAMTGLGANVPEDAIYPLSFADADGQPLKGENQYVLHFEKDEIPPVNAFWSVTMYDAEGFPIANPINRFAIGDRDPLKFNGDGSLDIYIQNFDPGGSRETNWLPSPKTGTLGVTMRLYAPKPQVTEGLWNPPPIRKVH